MKYVCPCGYVYDENWVCPVCGLGKDAFTEE